MNLQNRDLVTAEPVKSFLLIEIVNSTLPLPQGCRDPFSLEPSGRPVVSQTLSEPFEKHDWQEGKNQILTSSST